VIYLLQLLKILFFLGLVHIAPGHGMEDYEACKKLNIPTFCPVDEFGIFTSEVGESTFEGKLVLTDGTLAVIEYLKKRNSLIKEEKFKHKYPYDWRTKKPIILRATPQWFANVEVIKQKAIELLEDVKMVPKSGKCFISLYIIILYLKQKFTFTF
jgi:isoleucyl-tRNA synthetase